MYKLILIAALIAFTAAASDDAHAEVLNMRSEIRADGFDSGLDISNHIHQASSGDEHGNIHGDFEWDSPEGEHIKIEYVANENGYQPLGDVIPTPHPIPEAILKSIAYNEAHPSKEEHH
ncbi:larval cuticle protein 2-like [Lucilia sericata]|uniref:larval cuticle protein 2-like n=1 Tax=Lucilia sericata TaxID=13632 RepID=UPI0018A83DC3|nr:larval cuticle protein 2-like [Lucilia sericata]